MLKRRNPIDAAELAAADSDADLKTLYLREGERIDSSAVEPPSWVGKCSVIDGLVVDTYHTAVACDADIDLDARRTELR